MSGGHRHADEGPDIVFIVRYEEDGHPDIEDSIKSMAASGIIRGGKMLMMLSPLSPQQVGSFWEGVVKLVQSRRSEVVILHHFHDNSLPDVSQYVHRLRELDHRPVVAMTNGDAFYGVVRPTFPEAFLTSARAADAVFSTSLGRAGDYLEKHVGRPTALMPNGVCQVRFDERDLPPLRPAKREFRIALIASNNYSRKPWNSYHWYGRQRQRLVRALAERFGADFALFGRGWEGFPNWHGPIDFAHQQRTCRRAEVIVGGGSYSPARYYTSDRPFIQIASGVPFVDVRVDGVDTLLKDREHWYLADSWDQIPDICNELLSTSRSDRADMGLSAMRYLLENHRIVDRCVSMVTTLVSLRQALEHGDNRPAPDLSFLLEDVDLETELPRATRGWL